MRSVARKGSLSWSLTEYGQVRSHMHLVHMMVSHHVVIFPVERCLWQALGPGERDDRDVMAAMEASKREESCRAGVAEEDPDVLIAMAESR